MLDEISKKCPNLTEINISGGKITDRGVENLKALKKLRILNMDYIDPPLGTFPVPNGTLIKTFTNIFLRTCSFFWTGKCSGFTSLKRKKS